MGARPQPRAEPRAAERRAARRRPHRPPGVRRRAPRGGRACGGGCSPCWAARPCSATTSRCTPTAGTCCATTTTAARAGDEPASALLAAVGAEPDAPPAGSAGGGAATVTGSAAVAALRTAYRDELLVLAAADLAAVSEPDLPVLGVEDVAARLSDLAGAALRAALAVAVAEAVDDHGGDPGRLAIIAMGKCGGRELNYVSDVDVVFVAEPADAADRPARGPGDADRWARPASRSTPTCAPRAARARSCARSTATSPTTSGGPRPGSSRRCSRPGRSPATPSSGKAYAEAVAPMVWTRRRPARTSSTTCRPCAGGSRRTCRPDHADREIKLGPGGLRDVEFAVQLLQLVHGRADEALRSGSTLDALRALSDGGYVGRDDGANLAASYRFLRLLEHRLQLQRLRRTHLLPAGTTPTRCAGSPASAKLRPDGAQRRRRRAHGGVGAATPGGCGGCTRSCSTGRCSPRCRGCRPTRARLSAKEAAARLGALGWTSPGGRAAAPARRSPAGCPAPRRSSRPCCRCCSTSSPAAPTPTAACWPTGGCPRRSADTPWYLRLLRDEGLVAQRLMQLLGTSALVPDLLVRAPEVLRLLAAPTAGHADELQPRPGRRRRLAAAHASARQTDPDGRGRHGPLAAPPRAAARRVRGPARHAVDVEQVCAALSLGVGRGARGHAGVGAAVAGDRRPRAARAVRRDRHGPARRRPSWATAATPTCCSSASPSSGADERDAVRYASQVAETVRRRLGSASPDPALVVDADLRPEGRNGPLVRTLESYRAYYARWSQAWEAQALLRASPGGGRRRPRACASSRWSTRCATPPRASTRRPSPRSGGSRRGSTRSGCPAGPTAPCTPSSASAGSPTSSGRSSCCSCSTRATCRSCAPPSTLDGLREAGEAGLLSAEDGVGADGGLDARHPGAQRDDARARQARRPAAALGPRARRRRLRAGLPGRRRPRACSSTTTAAPRGAPAPSSSGSSTAGRPYPTDHSRGPRAQTAACCVVGRLEYARYETALRLAGSRLDHEAHRP